MSAEQLSQSHDDEPRIMQGEADDAFRLRVRAWHDRKMLEMREAPISPEEDETNRRMLERLRRGDFSDPSQNQAA
jgi:hypothetical protein